MQQQQHHGHQDEVDPAEWSWESDERIAVMAGGDAPMDFLAPKLNSSNKVKQQLLQEETSETRMCRYCGKEFKSGKALGGHLRIHTTHDHHPPASAAAAAGLTDDHRTKNYKKFLVATQEEEGDSFTCFVCDESFSTIKLLCQHARNHRDHNDYNYYSSTSISTDHQHPMPSQESSSSLAEEEEEGNVSPGNDEDENENDEACCEDLLKYLSNWSETGKRGRKGSSVSSDEQISYKVYNAVPLRVYFGPQVPLSERKLEHKPKQGSNQSSFTRKKLKTEENSPNQDHADSHESTDSESTVELLGYSQQQTNKKRSKYYYMSMMPGAAHEGGFCNKVKSSSTHERRLKNRKGVIEEKRVHQCEICGKTFSTGYALGGHKTYHRLKGGSSSSSSSRSSNGSFKGGQVLLLTQPTQQFMSQGEAADDQQHPKTKRLLDFDLNIPYQG